MRAPIRPFALALFLVSGWLVAGCDITVGVNSDALRHVERETRDFNVTGTPDVSLATFDGPIEVRAWDRAQVSIEIEKRGASKQAVDQIQVKASQMGNRITLEVTQPDQRRVHFSFGSSPTARLIVSVPRQANVEAHSGDGAITVERVTGKVKLDTGDGAVRVTEVAGELRARSGDGSMTLERVDGRIDADTEDGSITLDGKLEGVRLKSGDGSIRVRASAGSRMADDWDIHTGDGSVTVDVPEPFDATLDVQTNDGRVSIGSIAVKGDISRQSVRGQIGSGGRTLRVTTGDGGITFSRS